MLGINFKRTSSLFFFFVIIGIEWKCWKLFLETKKEFITIFLPRGVAKFYLQK